MPKPTAEDLEPPDLNQCQTMKPSGYTAFTLGGVPGLVRCINKPFVIATEVKAGPDGLIGSMSLCRDCMQQLQLEMPGHCTFKPVD